MVQGEECVSVTYYFAAGSNAQGCVVHMTIVTTHSSQHLHSWQFNVTQDPVQLKGTLHVPLEPRTSAVDVSVYDLTATGRIGFLSVPPRLIHSTGTNCKSIKQTMQCVSVICANMIDGLIEVNCPVDHEIFKH